MAFARKNIDILIAFLAVSVFLFLTPNISDAKLGAEDAKAVWSRVAKVTGLKDLPFSVKDEKTPNAWVANGNSVTVTTGLLELLDTQSELYGVLAHEAGHAKLDHHEDTVKRGVGLSVAATLLGKLLGGGIAETAAGVGANLAYSGWSREQEVEADDYSVRLAHSMGEDPVGLYSALLKLSKVGSRPQPSGFNSHPPDDRRLLHLKNEILRLDPKAKFPDNNEKGTLEQPQSERKSVTEGSAAQNGGPDTDSDQEMQKTVEGTETHPGGQPG